jgi:hypothetical protein
VKNLIIERVVKISVYLTAEQWQLYTSTYPAECSAIAFALNKTLIEYVNRGETREAVERFMLSAMRHAAEFGANDTEPRAVLDAILNEIFGEE